MKRKLNILKATVPKNWVEAKLNQVAILIMGQSPPSDSYNLDGEGMPFFQGKAEFTDLYPVVKKWTRNPLRIAEPNDILFCVRAPIGPTNLANKICCIGRGLCALRYIHIPKYLYYYFKYIEKDLDKLGSGTTFKSISLDIIEKIVIPLAPIQEQNRIAQKLDDLFGKLKDSQKVLNKVPGMIQATKNKIVNSAFDGTLTADWRTNNSKADDIKTILTKNRKENIGKIEILSKSELPAIPKTWKYIQIGDIETFIGSGITPRGGKNKYVRTGVPFLRSQNIYPDGLELDNVAYISKALHKKLSRTHIKPNDILLNITGASIGRSTVVPKNFKEGNVNQHVCIIRLPHFISPKIVSLYLNSETGQNLFFSEQSGVTREGFNYSQVRGLWIPIIPQEEQKLILKRIDSHLKGIRKVEQKFESINAKIQSLPRKLLEIAYTGKLVPQDLNDESAESLIKRNWDAKIQYVESETNKKLIELNKQAMPKEIDKSLSEFIKRKFAQKKFTFSDIKLKFKLTNYIEMRDEFFLLIRSKVISVQYDEQTKSYVYNLIKNRT